MTMIDAGYYVKQDIICIDNKSFFASVECVERGLDPMTAELCVVSRAESQGGLVLASSPEMKRKYNIRTGSRVHEIPKNKHIIIAPPQMRLYIERNRQINNIFKRYVAEEDCHVYSIDETFLDVGKSHALFGTSYQIARQIQRDIYKEYGLPSCVGIGDNLLLAKLCLDNAAKKNPPYVAYWSYDRVPDTVWKIEDLQDFWGIGSQMKKRLYNLGIYTVEQLAKTDIEKLKRNFGVIGEELCLHANGIDLSIISEKYIPKSKSLSNSQILERDYLDPKQIEIVISEMADHLSTRLRSKGLMAKQIGLYVGYSYEVDVKSIAKQMQIQPTDMRHDLKQYLLNIFRNHYEEATPVRRIGVSASKLMAKQSLQLNLFEEPETIENREELDLIIDRLRGRYGYSSLVHASSLLAGGTAIRRSKLVGGHKG